MSDPPETYVHGHNAAVLRSHAARTIANSAAYVADRLTAGARVLDVGCGPGTISIEMAQRVGPAGQVVAMDAAPAVLEGADARRHEAGVHNCRFEVGDVYAMTYGDAAFDVVHAHQVLQHLRHPVAALGEMRRVCDPNGVVAARDADYAAMRWSPAAPLLDRWLELYHQLTAQAGCEADAGRYLGDWAAAAGFTDVIETTSTWIFATTAERAWWADTWADRVLTSNYRDQALDHGLAGEDELRAIADAWRRWGRLDQGWFRVDHGEILATP